MMKVLVVESNIVMMEIISDVLSVDGFLVATATNANDAEVKLNSFSPNVIVFDVDTKGANVLNLISQIKKEESVRIIAICNSVSEVPSHNLITGRIVKPFKGSEILMAVRKAKNDLETRNTKIKKFSNLFGLFGSKKKDSTPVYVPPNIPPAKTEEKKPVAAKEAPVPEAVPADVPEKAPEPHHKKTESKKEKRDTKCRSFLVIEEWPKHIYDIGRSYLTSTTKLLLLTTGTIKYARTVFPEPNVTIYGLSKKTREGYFSYSKIGSIMGELGEFSKNNVNAVMIIEGVEDMIDYHGMSTVVTMICQLVDNGSAKGTVFLFSARPKTFSENEKKLLSHHLSVYGEPEEEEK